MTKENDRMEPIVEKLIGLIKEHDWSDKFEEAIGNAQKYDVPSIRGIRSLDEYLKYINDLLTWVPMEQGDSRNIYNLIVTFYFFLDQEPVKSLQSPIAPTKESVKCMPLAVLPNREVTPLFCWREQELISYMGQDLTPLSQWIVEYAIEWGKFMDSTKSAEKIESFKTDPVFNWDEYMPPPSGYLTFNQFFARHVKPGMRPIAGMNDNRVIVAPADSTFVGWWQINEKSRIYVEENQLNIKGIQWSIDQLLEGSEYADRFKGGIFTHSFLNVFDYHRWHAPVQGKILEAKVIQGQAYLDVKTQEAEINGKKIKRLNALDGTGYQFVQTRGLVVMDSPIGLVACLPMGMAQVSSVVITAEVGKTLYKGEELGYFQFGGSDFVIVFEQASNVQLICQPNVHYNQGTWIGNAYPYTMK